MGTAKLESEPSKRFQARQWTTSWRIEACISRAGDETQAGAPEYHPNARTVAVSQAAETLDVIEEGMRDRHGMNQAQVQGTCGAHPAPHSAYHAEVGQGPLQGGHGTSGDIPTDTMYTYLTLTCHREGRG